MALGNALMCKVLVAKQLVLISGILIILELVEDRKLNSWSLLPSQYRQIKEFHGQWGILSLKAIRIITEEDIYLHPVASTCLFTQCMYAYPGMHIPIDER